MFKSLLPQKNTIILTPSSLKPLILKQLSARKSLVNIKILNEDECFTKFYFDYDNQTLVYLYEKYHFPLKISKEIINALCFVDENAKYEHPKLILLQEILRDLKINNLLYPSNFPNTLSHYEIVVYGFTSISKRLQHLINDLKQYTKVHIHPIMNTDLCTPLVFELPTINDEITFIAHRIAQLLDQGTKIGNIVLSNVTPQYHSTIKRIFKNYNIPVDLQDYPTLKETTIGQDFLSALSTHQVNACLELITSKYQSDSLFACIYNQIINIINKYAFYKKDFKNLLPFIEEDFKNTKIQNTTDKNTIVIVDIEELIVLDNYHIFIISANYGLLPHIYKDEGFIDDQIKALLTIDQSNDINHQNRCTLIHYLKNIDNITLTYKLCSAQDTFTRSDLINELKLPVQQILYFDENISYSLKNDQLRLATYLDGRDEINPEFINLYHNLTIDYKTYDNNFKGLDNVKLESFLNSQILTLSYSSLDLYYKCPFQFYLQNILRAGKKETAFHQIIGNICHEVLSKAYDEGFDYDATFLLAQEKYQLSKKEIFFLQEIKKELLIVIDYNKEIYAKTKFKHQLFEQSIVIDFSDEKQRKIFKGIIDKIMYDEFEGKTYATLIDYKTGQGEIDLSNIKYGLSLQLPTYLYLITHSDLFKSVDIAGFYLQHILTPQSNLDEDNDRIINLRLAGYTLANHLVANRLDPDYQASSYIKSLRTKVNGDFDSRSKIKNKEEIDEIIKITEDKIKAAFASIQKGCFDISPAQVNNKLIPCQYCSYVHICYRNPRNYREIRNNERNGDGDDQLD